MAFRELTMMDVRELLRRWQSGQSIRSIARGSRVDRKTVRRYLAAVQTLGVARDGVIDDAVVHEVARCVQARPLPTPSEPRQELAPHRAQIEAWLGEGLRLTRVHTLLLRRGIAVAYATLRRFAMRELGWGRPKATVRIDDAPPGQEAQIDFAEMGRVADETGRRRKLHVLIVTLVFSRYQFVWPTFSQTTAAIIAGLEAAWRFFGAMPKTLVPDNASSMVVRADPTSPRLGDVFAEYVQTRGIFVDPARVQHPRDKARVERQVTYVRDGWFAGHEPCAAIEAWRQSAEHWCRHVAGARVHGTTRKVPLVVFEEIERDTMLPRATEPFDVPSWVEAKVHPDHHVQVARALYSVPTAHLHKRVRVRVDSKLVRIFVGTELIKMHARQPAGGRATDPNDYPVGKAVYALRSVDALIAKARERGAHVGRYAERILEGPLPWSQMRAAYALLSLCDKYGAGRVEAVCQSALGFDVVDVKRIARMLKLGIARAPDDGSARGNVVQLPLPTPRFARGDDHFKTRSKSKEESR